MYLILNLIVICTICNVIKYCSKASFIEFVNYSEACLWNTYCRFHRTDGLCWVMFLKEALNFYAYEQQMVWWMPKGVCHQWAFVWIISNFINLISYILWRNGNNTRHIVICSKLASFEVHINIASASLCKLMMLRMCNLVKSFVLISPEAHKSWGV